MYAQLFAFAVHAIENIRNKPKLLAASIKPDNLENYLKELLTFSVIPWAHDIHAYQKPESISEVYNQTMAVLTKYPLFHRDHIIVLEWGITDKPGNISVTSGNKSQIIDGISFALSRSLPVALHQFMGYDGSGFGISDFSDGKTHFRTDSYIFKQFIKQTPRAAQPNDWL